ncbi:rhomboid family intramembrane serine protease [Nemorincola caseinilytica]|uniref:Rhomboid family intramembrane serine protease n=1 Tax=Nemorincola caseinilytica TaxID=2054315 RepID=A0ABP8NGR9_9BACT
MNKGKRRSLLPYVPGYDNNAVLKLVFFIAGAYMALALTWAVMMMVNITDTNFNVYLIPNLSLPHTSAFGAKWWTVFTYGFLHVPNSFMNMLTNMLWLYCFGSIVQMLIGKKQILPLFLYSVLVGGLFYLAAQYLPGELGKCPPYIMGPRAGLMGICVAAVTLSPGYRLYLSDTFSIPLMLLAGIFAVLTLMGTGYYMPVVMMVLGGGLMGFAYVKMLNAGYRPGAWMYDIGGTLSRMVTPDAAAIQRRRAKQVYYDPREQSQREQQSRVDEILDKINRAGYNSLSKDEKEFLKKVGHDKN